MNKLLNPCEIFKMIVCERMKGNGLRMCSFGSFEKNKYLVKKNAMIKNVELELAMQFVKNTDRNLYITGKAGTGKTTFLHQIKNESVKRLAIVAPTGVAAINAKGVTIHSFFQLPFGPILPNQDEKNAQNQRRFSKKKIDIIRTLDLLIIDEISMVRADLLDGIDQVLRRYKNRHKVFGGVQILMIGDLQQLAPVVHGNEWSLLREHYDTAYFFSSKAFQQAQTVSIELKHIYRQDNQAFIAILNEIRKNCLSEKSAKILNQRFQPNFQPSKDDGYITLTTHNRKADAINQLELDKLPSKKRVFKAEITGQFAENSFPNSENLILKVGSQVLFIKNDSSVEKRYFNGKIGTIVRMTDESVHVQCPNEASVIETSRETWENIRYTIDSESKEIKEEVIGSFSQIPLRLAWAITIHKSQGLTFEKAIIDAEASFAHGQTYVALSRCTSLEGIVLKSPVTENSIINDRTVDSFSKQMEENVPDQKILSQSEKSYQLNLIAELFDYQEFLYVCNRMIAVYQKNYSSFIGTVEEPLQILKIQGIEPLLKVAKGFHFQLQQISETTDDLDNNEVLQERFQKAVAYFSQHTQDFIEKPLNEISYTTDNKTVEGEFEKNYETLQNLISVKKTCLEKLNKGFEAQRYLKIRTEALFQNDQAPKVSKSKANHDNDLAMRLRLYRDVVARADEIPHYQIFTQESLYELCEKLPKTKTDLSKITGMGKVRVTKYGTEILKIIAAFVAESSLKIDKKEAKPKKKSSKQISLELFKGGMSIEQIAKERDLVFTTIEGHLASFLPTKEIEISELMSAETFKAITEIIKNNDFENLTELKNIVGDTYRFSELRMVLRVLEL